MVLTPSFILLATLLLSGTSTWATPVSNPTELSQVLGRDLSQRELGELYDRNFADTLKGIAKKGADFAVKAAPYVAGAAQAASMFVREGSDGDVLSRSIATPGLELSQRELNELYDRNFGDTLKGFAKKGAHFVEKAAPYVADAAQAAAMFVREGSEDGLVLSRSVTPTPEMRAQVLSRELARREIDDLYARGMSFGDILKKGGEFVQKALPYAAAALPFLRSVEERSEGDLVLRAPGQEAGVSIVEARSVLERELGDLIMERAFQGILAQKEYY